VTRNSSTNLFSFGVWRSRGHGNLRLFLDWELALQLVEDVFEEHHVVLRPVRTMQSTKSQATPRVARTFEGTSARTRQRLSENVGRLVLTPTTIEGKSLFRVAGGAKVAGENGVMPGGGQGRNSRL